MNPGDDRSMLIDELRDLVGIRMAIVLVPAVKVLEANGQGDLCRGLQRFLGPLDRDIASVLARYDIKRKDELST